MSSAFDSPFLVTAPAGTLAGTDYSANEAAVPIATLVLLATVPVNTQRLCVEVQNQSAATIQIVRDDGAGGSAATILCAGTGASAQGGGWSSVSFKGRVRVYGASGAQVSVFED